MEPPIKIKVIIGSTRQGRFSEKPAHFVFEEAQKKSGVEVELLDLRDYPMPFFDSPISPSMAKSEYDNNTVKKWAEKIDDGDAFIIVTPEYNHGYPGVLKNALDSIYPEWNKKPVGFVSYGGVGGARSVEQLREVAIELQMIPIRDAVHIPWDIYMAIANEKAPVNPELFKSLRGTDAFIEQLLWHAKMLKAARV